MNLLLQMKQPWITPDGTTKFQIIGDISVDKELPQYKAPTPFGDMLIPADNVVYVLELAPSIDMKLFDEAEHILRIS